MSQLHGLSPTSERRPLEKMPPPPLSTSTSDPAYTGADIRTTTIRLRRLPPSLRDDGLHSMLLFAKDLISYSFVQSDRPEDQGYATAIARFQSLAGAREAQERLNGKPNATKEANMIVEVVSSAVGNGFGSRRNTIDGTASRQQAGSASSAGSSGGPISRQTSRFNSTFRPVEKVSPPLGPAAIGHGEFSAPDGNTHLKSLFSQQPPMSKSFDDRTHVSGKSVINDDVADDDTGELLKDPLAYAKSGHQHMVSRRPTNPQIPVQAFRGLSLSTNTVAAGPPMSPPFTSPRSMQPLQSPGAANSPTVGPNGTYSLNHRGHVNPPVNPADQHPPCNTLYVGNLPMDASEDELKALFSKQRGYRRLCFRTKSNGPMCFVEFDDISFATKALYELYGYVLHNSVKGGIRLSFSKNPLGVRTGQVNGMVPTSPMSPQAMSPGLGNGTGAPFSTANGPPPGLSHPTGRGMYAGNVYSASSLPMGGQFRSQAVPSSFAVPPTNGGFGPTNHGFGDFMMGR
ncbi:cell cycle RNA binding protein whi3 [Taxawa tesnikishii (nom. ined.)]|nr:cell cycle RNA binding protein whi3 [Dothideales sp. JES 119]